MSQFLRYLAAGLISSAIAAGPVMGQATGNAAKTEEPATKGSADKVASEKGAADKPTAGKGAADKVAPEKPAEDKGAGDVPATDKAAAARNPLSLDNDQIYSKSLAALTMLFVIAVLLENAFSVIFNWRVFLAYFSVRGVKTIIMIAISLLIVNAFGIDVMASLIAAYKSPPKGLPVDPASISGPASLFVTALILAGGSAGVNKIMTALGFRNDRREEDVAPRPPSNKAWVAVRVNRQEATTEVFVKIREVGPAGVNDPAPIAGVVGLKRARLAGLLFRDVNRFPENGGYTITPNVVYAITVETKNAQGNPLTALQGQTYVFAPGAIVDFEVTL
jgi:hypothetical protein